MDLDSNWDLIIEPKQSIFKLNLKDVWSYRDLLFLMVKRDFISFYKQTILGPIWFFIQPIMTTVVFVFVFGNLAGIQTDGIPQPLFYLSGIVAWNYFSDCLTKTSTVFKDNTHILSKIYFPRLIMPLSIVASNLVKLGVQTLLLISVFVFYFLTDKISFSTFHFASLLVPFYVLLMAALGLGLGMIISAMTTKYRDLSFFVTFGVQLMMYGTAVIYPLSEAEKKFSPLLLSIIKYNPMTTIIEGIRYGLFVKGTFSVQLFCLTVLIILIILLIGIVIFNRVERDFVDTV